MTPEEEEEAEWAGPGFTKKYAEPDDEDEKDN